MFSIDIAGTMVANLLKPILMPAFKYLSEMIMAMSNHNTSHRSYSLYENLKTLHFQIVNGSCVFAVLEKHMSLA